MAKRKSKVTKAIMQEVAERLAAGENLLKITEDDHIPSYRAITASVVRDEELFEIYRQGRVQQAEYYSDRINNLAESPLPTHHPDGTPCDNRWLGAEIQRRKLEVDTLKWTFARLQPHGIRDRKEDAPQQQAITISWAGGDVSVKGEG
jgi:hypothetical protein